MFNVGDRVRIVKATHGWGGEVPGTIGTITVKDSSGLYQVEIPGRSGHWYGLASCFEPIEDGVYDGYEME